MLSLCLDNTTELELTQIAQHEGKPMEQLLKDIVLRYLEDTHDAALGDVAMEELEQGKDAVIGLDEWINQ